VGVGVIEAPATVAAVVLYAQVGSVLAVPATTHLKILLVVVAKVVGIIVLPTEYEAEAVNTPLVIVMSPAEYVGVEAVPNATFIRALSPWSVSGIFSPIGIERLY
jgi:hypothetical protein